MKDVMRPHDVLSTMWKIYGEDWLRALENAEYRYLRMYVYLRVKEEKDEET